MSKRPPGLDDLLNYVVAHMPDPPCEHRHDTWFDRSTCAPPCGVMHTRCAGCGDPVDDCALQEIRVPAPGEHLPMYVRWENRHTVPAEVCDTCSDPATGKWVPVSFCDEAVARLAADPDCTYTYGVIKLED